MVSYLRCAHYIDVTVSASRDGMQCKLAFPSPGGLIAPLFIKRAPGTTKPNLAQSSAELDDADGASGVHGRQFKGLGSHFEATSPVFTAPQVDPHYWVSRATNCAGLHPVPDAINGAQTIVEGSGETGQPLFMQNPSHHLNYRPIRATTSANISSPVVPTLFPLLDMSKPKMFHSPIASCW
ncbi:DNA repair and recombination protein rhm52 [Fusarium oxysporum f. sp. albedinis]|nr:hypothetical protein HZ326_18747 [Fusarium oxysporum f. sp. albedinis]KAJ0138392.1 DNA repair and recombination protein rhm52 [Fusarium oxysporum f. sp. albedinis]